MNNFNIMTPSMDTATSFKIDDESIKKQQEYMKLVEQATKENKIIVKNEDGTYSLKSIELTEKDYENAVQFHINKVAQSKGYDDCYTCLSYRDSTVPKWKQEAEAFNSWRDACWMKCHEILNKYNEGLIPQPTIQEVINQLPQIEW